MTTAGAAEFSYSSTEPRNALAICLFFALCQSASIVAWNGGVGPPAESREVAFMTFQATALIGRDRELEILSGFLGQAAAEGGALLFTGEPGDGKR